MGKLQEHGFEAINIGDINDEKLGALSRAFGRLATQHMAAWTAANPRPEIDFSLQDHATYKTHAAEVLPSQQKHDRRHEIAAQRVPNQLMEIVGSAGKGDSNYCKNVAIFEGNDPKLYFHQYSYPDEPTYTPDTLQAAIAFDDFGKTGDGLVIAKLALDEVVLRGGEIRSVPNLRATLDTLPPALFNPYVAKVPSTT